MSGKTNSRKRVRQDYLLINVVSRSHNSHSAKCKRRKNRCIHCEFGHRGQLCSTNCQFRNVLKNSISYRDYKKKTPILPVDNEFHILERKSLDFETKFLTHNRSSHCAEACGTGNYREPAEEVFLKITTVPSFSYTPPNLAPDRIDAFVVKFFVDQVPRGSASRIDACSDSLNSQMN